jgi:hypothetical protein
MQSSRQIHVQSSRFAIEPGEDEEVNPGIYGRQFSTWLAGELPAFGWLVKRTIAEDFGRLVEVEHQCFRVYVACANGHDGEQSWQAFTIVEGGGLRGIFANSTKCQIADQLLADVERALRSDPQTIDVRIEGGDGA